MNQTVYILKSLKDEAKYYVGYSKDYQKRLKAHNAGKTVFSKRHSPWKLACVIHFEEAKKAREFEKYLKKGSGYAFLKKHLI